MRTITRYIAGNSAFDCITQIGYVQGNWSLSHEICAWLSYHQEISFIANQTHVNDQGGGLSQRGDTAHNYNTYLKHNFSNCNLTF